VDNKKMTEKLWYKATRLILKSGTMNIPINDIIIEIVKEYLTEEQAEFLLNFKPKKKYSFDQLKSITELNNEILQNKLDSCMKKGIIKGLTNKSTGVIEYNVFPLIPGFLEFMFMKDDLGETELKVAKLKQKLVKVSIKQIQKNYDKVLPMLKNIPTLSRTVPVEELVETGQEMVLPFQEISEIVENSKYIGVGNCFCRHSQAILNDPCKKTDLMKTCFMMGDTGEFLISQGIVEPISKEDALHIFKKCEDAGLVHKVYHIEQDINKEIWAVCNCCNDCCGIINGFQTGGSPLKDLTSYMAKVTEDECVGCGTCVDKCLVKAIELVDDIANVNKNKCMGCGLCAHHCPTGAMKLNKTELRSVFIPPIKLENV